MNTIGRPLIQDIVKSAMDRTTQRAKIAEEGARQLRHMDGDEPGSVESKIAGEEVVSTEYAHKLAAAVEYVLPHVKNASTQGPEGVSESQVSGQLPGPGGYGHAHHQPPMTPGAQKGLPKEQGATQMENTLDTHVPGTQQLSISGGHGKTAEAVTVLVGRNLQRLDKLAKKEKGRPLSAGESAGTFLLAGAPGFFGAKKAVESGKGGVVEGGVRGAGGYTLGALPGSLLGTTVGAGIGRAIGSRYGSPQTGEETGHAVGALLGSAAGGIGGGIAGYKGLTRKFNDGKKEKKASESGTLVDAFEAHIKAAADENNPAKISAGAAVPPDSSAAGEPGGAPAGGMPVGPRGLVHSNEAAINFKRSAAYAPRKGDLKAYLSEPALTSSTDSTLQAAFAHTGEAGTKLASEQTDKVAAAREILSKIVDRAQAQ